jgi:hypothetical protein
MSRGNLKQKRWLWVALHLALVAGIVYLAAGQAQAQTGGHVYLPTVPGGESVATPVPTPASGEQVFGLLGRLDSVRNRSYSYYLTTSDELLYGLAGETPAVEQQIAALAQGTPPVMVKVWGVLHDTANTAQEPMIVVSGILGTEAPAPVEGAATPIAIVKFDLVNLHAEPRESSATVGSVVLNQACNIIGRNLVSTWYLLDCSDGQEGWIDARLVEVQGSISGVPAVIVAAPVTVEPSATATPQPLPTVQTFQGWRMEMYANPSLSGEPVALADVPAIDFDWQNGSPDSRVPADNFSLRFERQITFSSSYYRFTLQADDGVRFWIDERLLIDQWHGATNQLYSTDQFLTGSHELRVEYYEASGLASLHVSYAVSEGAPVWNAGYYRGVTPEGTPVLSQQEPRGQNPLDYNWGSSSPLPEQLGVDFWSARWTGDFQFDYGNYVFRVNSDDGVRVKVDGLLVIDQWQDGYKEVSNRFIGVGQGQHTIEVEYYERTGTASLEVWWYQEAGAVGPR